MTNDSKNYPSSSDHISKLLKLEADSDPSDTTQDMGVFANSTGPMPANLPVLEGQLVTPEIDSEPVKVAPIPKPDVATDIDESPQRAKRAEVEAELKSLTQAQANPRTVGRVAKTLLPYIVVFVIGIFVYNFYFTDFSFLSLFKNDVNISEQDEKSDALDELIVKNRSAYESWMKQFYFDITDNSVLDPYADNSGNGLTNFQKFLLNLNPKTYDTLSSGVPDGQTVISGIDPATGKPFSDNKRSIIEKYFNQEAISNKLAAGSVASANSFSNSLISNSTNVSSNQVSTRSQSSGQTQSQSYGLNELGIDTDKPALIEIPSLNISAPLIWTKDTRNFDRDLKNGLVHYPGTALPGDIGTSYISGHSSNVPWIKSQYNKVFSSLDKLGDNETFMVTVTLRDGKKVKLHYVVKKSGQYLPNDQEQFANTAQSVVALSTCWPPGTIAKRLVVFGQLTQTQNLK